MATRSWAPLVAALVGMILIGQAWAQVLYEPVQYQYGRYGEVYYGGVNPGYWRTWGGGLDTPGVHGLVIRASFAGSWYRQGVFNLPVVYTPETRIYSDIDPYQEVGHLSFTINDARNEAYFNVPRYQAGAALTPNGPPPPEQPVTEGNPAAKAIPLLDWALAEHQRGKNPQLVAALLHEAGKYDAAATARIRAQMR